MMINLVYFFFLAFLQEFLVIVVNREISFKLDLCEVSEVETGRIKLLREPAYLQI